MDVPKSIEIHTIGCKDVFLLIRGSQIGIVLSKPLQGPRHPPDEQIVSQEGEDLAVNRIAGNVLRAVAGNLFCKDVLAQGL